MKMDYSSKAERKAWERKWGTLQAIKTAYLSFNKVEPIIIPIQKIVNEKITSSEVRGVLNGLQTEECFKNWNESGENFSIDGIDDKIFERVYKNTERIYKKYATNYQKKVGAEAIRTSPYLVTINVENKQVIKGLGKDQLSCYFHGLSKRFDYIVKIANEPGISANKLRGSGTIQNVSTEINKINERLQRKLKLLYDFIINENNTGYRINKKYKVILN